MTLFIQCTEMMDTIQAIPQPVIAKVHALATAAGCQLVASCDLAVAADTAGFAIPGGKGGLFCHTPLVAVARNVGRKRALEMALSGDVIDAATAADWGLVNQAVPADELDEAVATLVARVTRGSAWSRTLGKRTFYAQVDLDQRAGLRPRRRDDGRRRGPRGRPGGDRRLPRQAARAVHQPPLTGGDASVCRARRAYRASSPHAANPELDRDPRADGLGGLQDGVVPGALARPAHDDEVAVPGRAPARRAAAARTEDERPVGADREDGDDRVLAPGAADPVAVPGHRVVAVAVEAHPAVTNGSPSSPS